MAKISEIVAQNPWWKHEIEFTQYDQNLQKARPIFFERREIELKKGSIYILRGPRQVGKTTYIKDTIKGLIKKGVPSRCILYLSLDFFTSRREMRNAVNYFLDLTRDAAEIYILLDEITSIADWNLELKIMADQGKTAKAIILATGSSAVKIKEKVELLPGRGLEGNEYYIKPLSFREFVLQSSLPIARWTKDNEFEKALKKLNSVLKECNIELSYNLEAIKKQIQQVIPFKQELGYLFQAYLMTGGFPRVINHYLSNRYLNDKNRIEPEEGEIFIRDVLGDLSRLQRQETIVRQILGAIVKRYGSRYTFQKLAREIERTHVATIDYLEFLEDSFISFVLYAYDFNKKEPKLKGDKKVYFFDPLIFHSVKSYLTGEEIWNTITVTTQDEDLQSTLVEGMVISHLLMHREIPFLKSGRTFLWSYYDKRGREIDAILKEDGEYSGIEVKYQAQVSRTKMREVPAVKKYIILSKEESEAKDDTLVVPVDIFLSLLSISKRNV
jgi:predicted AAA+ superfamily ATPase